MNRAFSAIVLAAGIALLVYGYRASESVTSETSETFTGTPTHTAMYLMVGGGVLALVGLVGLFRGARTRTA
jgi:TRAP-type C4-dicarboxylate transport system permease small subunit